jgi:hypothetical protein
MATGGSASGNAAYGIRASDATLSFCGNPDCTVAQLAVATAASLDHMRLENNASQGFTVSPGGIATIRVSSVRGNGWNGISTLAGFDYDLGDGVVHHIDIAGTLSASENQVVANGGTGITVQADGDPTSNQRRPSARLEENLDSGNAVGLEVDYADVRSVKDHYDQNQEGMHAGSGASLTATEGSASENRPYNGVTAWDAFFVCGNADCSRTQIRNAPVRVTLENMVMDGNGFAGCYAGAGSDVKIAASTLRGNSDGVFAYSGFDYDLGDGVPHHRDNPDTLRVSESVIQGNSYDGVNTFDYVTRD